MYIFYFLIFSTQRFYFDKNNILQNICLLYLRKNEPSRYYQWNCL